MTDLRIGSLFSGYGGLDMAVANVTGATTAWVSDIDKGACKILTHRYGEVPNLGDITNIDWATVEPVDIITGGFPCQDLSHAGKRAGLKEGTRSGLWSHMAKAIDVLRPRLVVAENVRGLLSADAPGDVEPCSWCVGETPTVNLRALGVVLADLADLGYDAQWCGLRAADVGACHGRFRVFLIAHPAGDPWRLGDRNDVRDGSGAVGQEPAAGRGSDADTQSDRWDQGRPEPARILGRPDAAERGDGLLRTPTAQLAVNGGSQHPDKRKAGGHGPTLADEVEFLLPTPKVGGQGDNPSERRRHTPNLEVSVNLLPTPTSANAADGADLDQWEDARAELATKGYIEAQRLLPTPTRRDYKDHEIRREPHRPDDVDTLSRAFADPLLPTPTATDAKASGGGYNGQNNVTLTDATTRNGMLLPTPSAADALGGHERRGGSRGDELLLNGMAKAGHLARFGDYAPAIARWESAIGRPAPDPTEPTGKGGAHRLSPKFVEFMMGLPKGWVTDVPGLTRNEALKALGNGVVPAQAEAALRHMLAWEMAA